MIFAKLGQLKELRDLKLRECKINDSQFDSIVNELQGSKLKTIDMSFNNITNPEEITKLFKVFDIKSVNLSRNQLGVEQINTILSISQYCTSLKKLDLSSNGYADNH